MTRREILQSAAAQLAPPTPWFDRPMRWVQLAFVEDDPSNYNPSFWLDYFKRLHAGAACLSAGGCVAFYPTQIPLHYKSKFITPGSDPFGELLQGCRKLNMNVIARIDPHAAHDDLAAAHPDFIACDHNNQPRRHWAMPSLWLTCALGPYNFSFMRDVVREIVSLYNIDGVFSNRWSGSGPCYCQHCRRNFHDFARLPLPAPTERRTEAARLYSQWRQTRLFELWDLYDADIRKARPHAAFIPNTGGGAQAELDMKRAGARAPILFADRQARSGLALPSSNGMNAKEYLATMPAKPVGGIFSIGLEAPYRWKDSVQSPAEIQAWAINGIAHGLRPWITKFNAKPLDSRWFKPVEDIFAWHARNEPYLRNTRSLARTAIVFSQQTAHSLPNYSEDFTRGAYHALLEARIPFDMVHDGLLDAASLAPYRTLVLPNIACLSPAQCAQLTAFVEAGGALIATHETSLYDETGRRLPNFTLAPLFGVSYAGQTIERQQNAYLDIALRAHPLLDGLRDAGRFIHGVRRVEINASLPPAHVPLTTMPSYPDLPMEEVYLRQKPTNIPAAICRPHGQGRIVYFPFDLDRTFWEVLSPDHGRLLSNAVLWAANEPQPLSVHGPGLIDVALWRQQRSLTAHLVNLTNPYAMKGPFREILPVAPQTLRLRCPQSPQAAKWLVSGAPAQFKFNAGWLETTSPPIHLHEVLALDL